MSALTDDTLPVTPRAVRDEIVVFAVMAVLLALVPVSGIYPFFVMQALCFALLACAFNLLIGYGGLLSFGHAMFLGTAGYFTAHALKVWGLSPELGILVGTAGAAALGVITGLVAIRRQGIYFAMITLALSQLLFFIYLQTPFTHGEDGIQGVPQGYLFGIFNLANPTILYYVILAGFLLGFLLIFRTINAVRRGAESDPGKRAARDLAGLQDRPVQAAGLYPLGHAGGICRLAESVCRPERLAHRRPLDHVG
jgi:branched-chain amino acid transport system permease protein